MIPIGGQVGGGLCQTQGLVENAGKRYWGEKGLERMAWDG